MDFYFTFNLNNAEKSNNKKNNYKENILVYKMFSPLSDPPPPTHTHALLYGFIITVLIMYSRMPAAWRRDTPSGTFITTWYGARQNSTRGKLFIIWTVNKVHCGLIFTGAYLHNLHHPQEPLHHHQLWRLSSRQPIESLQPLYLKLINQWADTKSCDCNGGLITCMS